MADSLQKIKYFPPLLSEMVRIGEETGTLENSLHSTAVFYKRHIVYFVERLSTILEPFLLLCVGLFIGLLIFFDPIAHVPDIRDDLTLFIGQPGAFQDHDIFLNKLP